MTRSISRPKLKTALSTLAVTAAAGIGAAAVPGTAQADNCFNYSFGEACTPGTYVLDTPYCNKAPSVSNPWAQMAWAQYCIRTGKP